MGAPHCPNCGNGFPDLRPATRMFDCTACGTTLFRDASGLRSGAQHGEMAEAQMLLSLGARVTLPDGVFEVIGHARYDYGRGWWDEFWTEAQNGDDGLWISVDEGDVATQYALPPSQWPELPARRLGASMSFDEVDWTVTEVETATCIAIRGQFPDLLEVGEAHGFLNLSAPGGQLLSAEVWEGGTAWYRGRWRDPFALKVRGTEAGP